MSSLRPGMTIFVALPNGTTPHLFIVLTEPFSNPERVVLVNLSSCRDLPFEDHTTIISVGEHPFVQHDSYVAYDYARKALVEVIERKLAEGKAEIREPLSTEVYSRILAGAIKSPMTPGEIKSLCKRFAQQQP